MRRKRLARYVELKCYISRCELVLESERCSNSASNVRYRTAFPLRKKEPLSMFMRVKKCACHCSNERRWLPHRRINQSDSMLVASFMLRTPVPHFPYLPLHFIVPFSASQRIVTSLVSSSLAYLTLASMSPTTLYVCGKHACVSYSSLYRK